MLVAWEIVVLVTVAMLLAAALASVAGVLRWKRASTSLRDELHALSDKEPRSPVDFGDFVALPAVVARYFRTVLTDGQPRIRGLHLHQTGWFNMSDDGERWKPLCAEQWVSTQRPGFLWDARIRILPGLPTFVWDAYVDGRGYLIGKLLGLLTVVRCEPTQELAEGELLRFLAEAPWCPTALVPGEGVSWAPVDERSAKATMVDGEVTASVTFRFGSDDLIESFLVEARGRLVGDKSVPTPWEGQYGDYRTHDGMLVPMEGEVRWAPPDAPSRAYWRGRVQRLAYEYAEVDGP